MKTIQNFDTKQFSLINGEYSAEEAREILMELLVKKISFHTMRNLSYEIRYKKADPHSQLRIHELEATQEKLLEILKSGNGKRFKVTCNIEIQEIDHKTSEFAQDLPKNHVI